MFDYTIHVEAKAKTCLVSVIITDEMGSIVKEGKIEVCTTDILVAKQYAEEIFLPDLRFNEPELATLELPIDVQPEATVDPE